MLVIALDKIISILNIQFPSIHVRASTLHIYSTNIGLKQKAWR